MASATITTTTAVEFIPTLWSAGTLDAIEFAARIQKRVNRRYESELKVGNTLNIPQISNLTTATKSSGLASVVSFEAITQDKEQITVSTHEYAAFLLEDIVSVQSAYDLRSKYEKKIGYALSRGREVSLAALPASLSQSPTGVALGVELTTDDYLGGYQKFAEAGLLEDDVEADDAFSIFLSPAEYISVLKTDVFVNRQYNQQGDAINRARVGKIYSFDVFVSNLVKSNGAGHDNFMMHRDCFALIVQKVVPVRSSWIIENIADGVVGWNVYGVDELNYPVETPGSASKTDSRGVWLKGK